MAKWTGKRIVKMSLYQEASDSTVNAFGLEHLPFIILYVISLYYCYLTVGEQYIEALTKAEEQEINIYDESDKLRLSAMSYLSGGAKADSVPTGPSFLVPSKWLPGFWPSIAFGVTVILHLLMILGQKWSVGFRCLIRFRKVSKVSLATHVHVSPRSHQGKEELIKLQRTSSGNTYFEFHRRKYVYDSKSDTFTKVRCRIDYPIGHYLNWLGLPSDQVIHQLFDLYGPNKFQMSAPSFLELYFAQITSPFTVFQLFCVILWCLDEYWQYSIFTLFMICTFEATTVFSRLKSMSMLKGMGNENRAIFVHRNQKWQEINTDELLPGDVFSLTKHKDDIVPCDAMIIYGSVVVNEATLTGESIPQMKDGLSSAKHHQDDVVNMKGEHKTHALFGGTRILQVTSMAAKAIEIEEENRDESQLNESSSTSTTTTPPPIATDENNHGLKDEVVDSEETSLNNNNNSNIDLHLSNPPDNGCVCYVTRTGFSSSQGKLVRMIENSTASVRSDSYDTALLLLLLLLFALSASGYVLYKGMQQGTQSRYQLLLHCILIITSVIPPELPMQTALAVNNSLMTLMKMQIFCTEPFRVPIAGKVDTCIFDKTGTLTTDELVAVGVITSSMTLTGLRNAYQTKLAEQETSRLNAAMIQQQLRELNRPITTTSLQPSQQQQQPMTPVQEAIANELSSVSVATAGLLPMTQASPECTFILGGCHSLVLVDGKVGGDPLEAASLKAIKWELSTTAADTARPKPELTAEQPLILPLSTGNLTVSSVKILARHHFSSKLQRMSVVVKVGGDSNGCGWVLVKGSPEMIATMCLDCPKDYHLIAADLAKRGMRVIALALRRLETSEDILPCCESRLQAERSLTFAGFVSFTCRVRKDSSEIIRQLRLGGNVVAMATGDAMLTAIHVAKEVGIISQSKKGILLLESKENNFYWSDYETGNPSPIIYTIKELCKLAIQYDLCVSGSVLAKALQVDSSLSKLVHLFVVFARMRPDEKEQVLLAMKQSGRITLMCGDGANDVGALKEAHVGVALLTGFGDLNATREQDKKDKAAAKKKKEAAAAAVTNESSVPILTTAIITKETEQELLKCKISELKKRLRQIGVEPDDYPSCIEKADLIQLYRNKSVVKLTEKNELQRQKDLMAMTPQERQKELARERTAIIQKKQEEFKKIYDDMLAKGESWAMVKAMQAIWKKEAEETKKNKKEIMAKNSIAGSAGRMAAMMEDMQNMEDLELPMVKIGDASVASPFTSKMPSIRGTLDIIRQGRCTLVTTIQMYQILAMNCLISAYSLSVLRLDGIKYGDIQMTCLGILMSVSFVTVSRSKPLDELSPVSPLRSIFHPALFLSLLGQFGLHLVTMIFLVYECKKYLPEGFQMEKTKVFQPNIVNSVVFLVTAVQQVSVFVVNLKGPPFMGGLAQNTPLMWSLAITFVGTFLCASESIPQMNKWLQLEPFPSTMFRNMVLGVLAVDVSGAFLWDRLMLGVFAFPLLKASLKGTTSKDIYAMVRVLVIVSLVVSWLASQDYTEVIKELERQEQIRLGGVDGGGQSPVADIIASTSSSGTLVDGISS